MGGEEVTSVCQGVWAAAAGSGTSRQAVVAKEAGGGGRGGTCRLAAPRNLLRVEDKSSSFSLILCCNHKYDNGHGLIHPAFKCSLRYVHI